MTVEEVLSAIPGTVRVARLDRGQVRRVVELETRHERTLVLPVRNLGISMMASRESCLVILKSAGFRAPKVPSVYMVEEGSRADDAHVLSIAGKRYSIIGEEVIDGHRDYGEPVIPLENSFVIFPQRRRNPRTPCIFLLPPLPFPELESASLGVADVISISPSLVVDGYLRETFGFSASNEYATLLVGFNSRPLQKSL